MVSKIQFLPPGTLNPVAGQTSVHVHSADQIAVKIIMKRGKSRFMGKRDLFHLGRT